MKGFILPCGQSLYRLYGKDRLMRILQQISVNQLLIIALCNSLLQLLIGLIGLDMHKRLFLIIQPAVHCLQTKHQSFRIGAKIPFSVFEGKVIDSRLQCLSVDTFLHQLFQSILDHGNKGFLLVFIRILGYDTEVGLCNPIFHGAVNILTDPCINQSLLYRCSRCRTEHIVKNIHCRIQLSVKAASHGDIIGQIGVLPDRFIIHNGIFLYDLPFLCKRLLLPDL